MLSETINSNICRPMYIDSTNAAVPDGDLTVASLLRENVEPLLKVQEQYCYSKNIMLLVIAMVVMLEQQ